MVEVEIFNSLASTLILILSICRNQLRTPNVIKVAVCILKSALLFCKNIIEKAKLFSKKLIQEYWYKLCTYSYHNNTKVIVSKKILIVEDIALMLEVMAYILSSNGYEV